MRVRQTEEDTERVKVSNCNGVSLQPDEKKSGPQLDAQVFTIYKTHRQSFELRSIGLVHEAQQQIERRSVEKSCKE